jgi:hypothetical protein
VSDTNDVDKGLYHGGIISIHALTVISGNAPDDRDGW